MDQFTMRDPRDQYPKPKFPNQPQSEPGLAQDVQPKPDHGEQSPYGQPGQPAELAPVYVLLASQESSYTTGEIYGVTGGNPLP